MYTKIEVLSIVTRLEEETKRKIRWEEAKTLAELEQERDDTPIGLEVCDTQEVHGHGCSVLYKDDWLLASDQC